MKTETTLIRNVASNNLSRCAPSIAVKHVHFSPVVNETTIGKMDERLATHAKTSYAKLMQHSFFAKVTEPRQTPTYRYEKLLKLAGIDDTLSPRMERVMGLRALR